RRAPEFGRRPRGNRDLGRDRPGIAEGSRQGFRSPVRVFRGSPGVGVMSPRTKVGLGAVIATVGLVCGSVRAAEDPKPAVDRDLVYTKGGGTELKRDLARPAQGEGAVPAVRGVRR